MWHPFKKVTLQAVTKQPVDLVIPEPEATISEELEVAQLRSLKARTEISMIYERLANSALINMKGASHAANN